MAECRACDAPIIWAVTEANGKSIPLDAEPDPAGNVVMTGATRVTQYGEAPEVRTLGNTTDLFGEPEVRYMPHHATCPEVEQFRT